MSKKTWIIGGVAVLAIAGATILGRSLNHANDSKGSTGSNKVTTLKVAHTQNYVPYDFVDEKGESDGYEVAVLKAIDEKLPDYKFEYTGTSDDDLLIGASIIGFTVRKEDANKYKNIDDFAKEKGKLVPISPQNAQWNVIKEYNEKHKDQQIELTAAESFKVADAYAWVLEGRYDAFFDIKLSFEKAVTDKDGSYHQYADKLSWFAYKGIPTYPLIHKDKKNEKFAEAYSKAIKELEKDGTLAKLSKKYFGEDVFSYVDKEK